METRIGQMPVTDKDVATSRDADIPQNVQKQSGYDARIACSKEEVSKFGSNEWDIVCLTAAYILRTEFE